MNKEQQAQRKAWLAALKVGDEMAVVADESDVSRAEIRRLVKVDRFGFMWEHNRRAEQINTVGSNGRVNGPYGRRCIVPVTDAIRAAVADRDRTARLRCVEWERLSPATREAVCRVLDDAQSPTVGVEE
jgi:hypothetical protein